MRENSFGCFLLLLPSFFLSFFLFSFFLSFLTASQTDAEWPELNPISQMVLTAGMRARATCILRRR